MFKDKAPEKKASMEKGCEMIASKGKGSDKKPLESSEKKASNRKGYDKKPSEKKPPEEKSSKKKHSEEKVELLDGK